MVTVDKSKFFIFLYFFIIGKQVCTDSVGAIYNFSSSSVDPIEIEPNFYTFFYKVCTQS